MMGHKGEARRSASPHRDSASREFRRALRAFALRPGDPVVLGVSGGADSLAMLCLFAAAQEEFGLRLAVLHVHHGIRGADADGDARFVEVVCAARGVACRVVKVDVPALARQEKLSLEEAARQARYAALFQEAVRIDASWVAVAHNADDQAETVLMHFLRGSGMAGLRGMLPVASLSDHLASFTPSPVETGRSSRRLIHLIRPLLNVPRADIERYCRDHDLTPRQDATNADTTYFRNKLRHEALPLLASLNPNLRETLGRTASVMAADYEWHQAELEQAALDIMRRAAPGRVELDLASWRSAPLSVQRGLIRAAVMSLRAHVRDLSFEQVEQAGRVAREGAVGAQAPLPGGLTLRVDYDALVIAPEGASSRRPEGPLLEPGAVVEVNAPGSTNLSNGWQFTLARYDGLYAGREWKKLLRNRWAAVLNLPGGAATLRLRTRLPGDHFQPQGAGGSQKLSDFMINAKIPAAWRGHIPLLTAGDELAWVCGWRVDQRFTVTAETQEAWLAKFEKA